MVKRSILLNPGLSTTMDVVRERILFLNDFFIKFFLIR